MSVEILMRILLPGFSLGIFALIAKAVKAPRPTVLRALKVGWMTGVLNLAADVAAIRYGFRHYTMPGLVWGLPLDIYITVSLVYGAGLVLIYGWIKRRHGRWVLPFLAFLPFYGVIRDYLNVKWSGETFLVWDRPSWWVLDFFCWGVGLGVPLWIFETLERDQTTTPKP